MPTSEVATNQCFFVIWANRVHPYKRKCLLTTGLWFRAWSPDIQTFRHLSWYLVPGTWYLVRGTWYLVPGTKYLVYTWYQVPGTWYQIPGTWYLVLGTWYQVPGTEYQVPGTWMSNVCNRTSVQMIRTRSTGHEHRTVRTVFIASPGTF